MSDHRTQNAGRDGRGRDERIRELADDWLQRWSAGDSICRACGSTFSLVDRSEATGESAPLETVGHFEIVSRLGVGAFGTVWKAHDTELDRTVALKIPRIGHLDVRQEESNVGMSYLAREQRCLAKPRSLDVVALR